jgi:two-component system phosphate regulon response regulator PhoB
MTTVAIIEDEADISDMISYHLRREGFDVISASTGDVGMSLIKKRKPDLVLLDLMLPNKDGLQICREMKDNPALQSIPIIMVSAKSEESDIVLGLGMEADDYITKPFSPRELVARVKAVLRRHIHASKPQLSKRIEQGGLIIDASKHKVSWKDQEIVLTATEFKLLHYLASHPGRVFSREQLLNQTVGDNVVVVDRNVDVHVRAIRRKMGEANFIETIRGVGYRFREGESS